MWWRKPTLPVTDEERDWIDRSFRLLTETFGKEYLRNVRVLLPTPEYFPDPFSGTPNCVRLLLNRVAMYAGVDPRTIDLEIYTEGANDLREHLPFWEGRSKGTAGQYFTPETSKGRHLIRVESQQLNDPTNIVATLAHEVAHVILLGGGRVEHDDADHELLTDLFTVFSGFGIFNANSAFMFKQYVSGTKIGWSSTRQGYFSQEMWGYALAGWVFLRNDTQLDWTRYLSINVRSYMKKSLKYLKKGGTTDLTVV